MSRTVLRRMASHWRSPALSALFSDQRGVVLVAVLWICALIMWFAFQISAETRLQGEDQIHSLRYSQALHLAIGGSYEALARMGSPPPLERGAGSDLNWQPDGQIHIVPYDTGSALVIAESEDLKVNVNRVGLSPLKQLLEKAGADDVASERLADCILDFIDKDDIPRLHGAEKDAYSKAGLNYIPFNGPLTSLDQLLLIPGITQQLFYGFSPTTNPRTAQSSVNLREFRIPGKYSLFSMLTIYGNKVNLLQDPAGNLEADPRPPTWRQGGTYRILSFGKSASGPPTVGVWLIVRFSADADNPYTVLFRKVL